MTSRSHFALVAVLFSVAACGKQVQGERCLLSNGNDDCDDGLTCVKADTLQDNTTDRCCPTTSAPTDSRCAPRKLTHSLGTGATSSTGGATSNGGQSAGGNGGTAAGGGAGKPGAGGTAGQPAAGGGAGKPAVPSTGGGATGGAKG